MPLPVIQIRITDEAGNGVSGLSTALFGVQIKNTGTGDYESLSTPSDYSIAASSITGIFTITFNDASTDVRTGYYKILYDGSAIKGYEDILYIKSLPLGVEDGGTGNTTIAGFLDDFDLEIGTDILPYSSGIYNFLASGSYATGDGVVVRDGLGFNVKTFSQLISDSGGSTASNAAWKKNYSNDGVQNTVAVYGQNGQLHLPVIASATTPDASSYNNGDMIFLSHSTIGYRLLVRGVNSSNNPEWFVISESA
jgi:hypothetical protein